MAGDWLGTAKLLIDGSLIEAEGGARYGNVNPATEEVIGDAPDASPGDVDAAIAAARRAFDETDWSTNTELRVRCLRQLHEALEKYAEPFKALTVAEVGVPAMFLCSMASPSRPSVKLTAFEEPVAGIRWFADLLEQYDFVEDFGSADMFNTGMMSHRWTEREAVGVVGAITPWNVPTMVNLAKVGPALAAGNALVLKGAPSTPWSSNALAKIVAENTEIPPGIFNVITSGANERGQELVTDPRVDLITFTGSTATGRKIMSLAGETVKRCFLELGGKSANVVLEDADFVTAVGSSAVQVMTHGGQGCAAHTRLILPRSRFDEGVELAAQIMSSMPYGDPENERNLMGPLSSARQRDRVEGLVERAKEAGGKPVIGGRRPPEFERGFYYEPTLFADMDQNAEIVQTEVFGPVLVVLPFDDEDEAVRIANNSIYGLSCGVHSADAERAKQVARRIRAGTAVVNGGVYYGYDVPFGGYKQSGIGRENGRMGFEEYTEVKTFAEPV